MPDIIFPNAYTHDTTNKRPFRRLKGNGLAGDTNNQMPAVNNPYPDQSSFGNAGRSFTFRSVDGTKKTTGVTDTAPVTDEGWHVPVQPGPLAPAILIPREEVVPYDRTPPANYEEPYLIINGYLEYNIAADGWRPVATYCSRGLVSNTWSTDLLNTTINFANSKSFDTYTLSMVLIDTSYVGISTEGWAMAPHPTYVALRAPDATWYVGDRSAQPSFTVIISGKNN